VDIAGGSARLASPANSGMCPWCNAYSKVEMAGLNAVWAKATKLTGKCWIWCWQHVAMTEVGCQVVTAWY